MTRYQNGRISLDQLVLLASGTDSNGYWEHRLSPASAARLAAAQAYAKAKWGRAPKIAHGWNGYRPIAVQTSARKRACAQGNCAAAASPGYSSHGGTWLDSHFTGGKWVDALAVDIDPNGLTWAQVDEAMKHAGWLIHGITVARAGRSEPWHYIDLNPWTMPATVGTATPFPNEPEEEDTMYAKASDGATVYEIKDGKKRGITGPEWAIIKAAYAAAGRKVPYASGTVTTAQINKLPNA